MEGVLPAPASWFELVTPTDLDSFEKALSTLTVSYRPLPRRPGVPLSYEAQVRTRHAQLSDVAALADAAERLGELRRLARTIRIAIARDLPRLVESARVFVQVQPPDIDEENRSRIVLTIETSAHPTGGRSTALARVKAAGWLLAA